MVLLESVLLLVVAMLDVVMLDWSDIDTLLPDAEDVCTFETLEETIGCSLQPSGSCTIYKLPKNHCYRIRQDCREDKIFKKKKDFDDEFNEEENMTTLYVWNSKERRLLLTTELESEFWWQVDLPVGEHNVTITNLTGRLNESHPIKEPKFCYGCPSPRVMWVPYQHLHMFQIAVLTEDWPPNMSSEGNVDILMYSTNETLRNCYDPIVNMTSVASGMTNKVFTVEEIYGINFCFEIYVNFMMEPNKNRVYSSCFKQEDMAVSDSYSLPHTRIDIPVWWNVGLVLVIVCLILASLGPYVIHKGLLQGRCLVIGSRHHRLRGNAYAHMHPGTSPIITFIGASGHSAAYYLARPGGEENLPFQNAKNEPADSNRNTRQLNQASTGRNLYVL